MRPLIAWLALLTAVAGCEDHHGAAVTSGPVQILPGGAYLGMSTRWLGDSVVYATQNGSLADLWRRRLEEPGPELIASGVESGWGTIWGEGPLAGWLAMATPDAEGTHTLTLRPLDGPGTIVIDRMQLRLAATLRADACAMNRSEPDGKVRWWRGTCDALRPLPPGLDVLSAMFDRAGHWLLLARVAGETGRGIYDLADDDTVAEIVPPALAGADTLPGFEETAPVVSSSVGETFEEKCWEGSCRLFYDRLLSDGTCRRFAVRRDGAREVLLPSPARADARTPERSSSRFETWVEAVGLGVRYSFWDLQTDRVKSCDVAQVGRRFELADSRAGVVLFGGAQTAPLGVTVGTSGDEPCVSVEQPALMEDKYATGLSYGLRHPRWTPDGASLVWLSPADTGVELWAADRTGQNPRKLMDTPDAHQIRFFDRSDEILVKHRRLDGEAFSLVVLGSEQPIERPLAGGVFQPSWWSPDLVRVGPRALLMGTSFDSQDGTGELSIVDLDSGRRRVLDSEVSEWSPLTSAVVGYVVRGRYPSARDGLWVRKLP